MRAVFQEVWRQGSNTWKGAVEEGRRGSEEVVRENLGVPLEGDRDVGARCGSHQGCQVPFRPPIPKVGLLLRRCSGKGLHNFCAKALMRLLWVMMLCQNIESLIQYHLSFWQYIYSLNIHFFKTQDIIQYTTRYLNGLVGLHYFTQNLGKNLFQRHYFANKGLSSQSFGFSSSHVWM